MAELPFDMLRGGRLDFNEQDEYERRMAEQGYLTPQQSMAQTLPINPLADIPASMPEDQRAQLAAERGYTLRRAGFMPDGKGGFVDPQRDIAGSAMVRLQMMQERDKRQTEVIANSMLFKAGDTLADAGRIFLSPLFWLKGQDQSQYDPSDRLKTGYNLRFNEMNELREATYEKFVNSRNQRLAAATTLENSRANQRIQMMSPQQKELYAFAQSSPERMALYNETDPASQQASYDQLMQQYMLSEDKGLLLKDTQGQQFYLSDNQVSAVDRYSKAFVDETQTLREGFGNIQQLLSVKEDGTGITDVAAIFAFIKGIDPGSVVRESEVQLFQQTLSLIDQIELAADRVGGGRLLSADQIKELKRYAKALGEAMGRKFNDRKQTARAQLAAIGLESEELQNNYLGGYEAPTFDQQTTTGPTGAVPAGGAVDQLLNQGIDELMKLNEGQTPSMMQGVSGAKY